MHCRKPTRALKNTAPNASEMWPGKISVTLLCRIRVSPVTYCYGLRLIPGLSSIEKYSHLIRKLMELTSEEVYKHVASEPSIVAAMAQRASIDLKIRQSMEYVTPNQSFFVYL